MLTGIRSTAATLTLTSAQGEITEDTEAGIGGIPVRVTYVLQGLWPDSIDGNALMLPMTKLTVTDYDFTEVIGNIQKARRSWARLLRVMGQEGTYARKLGHLYLEIVHSVLIFGLETGVMTPHIGRFLGGIPPPSGIMDQGGINHKAKAEAEAEAKAEAKAKAEAEAEAKTEAEVDFKAKSKAEAEVEFKAKSKAEAKAEAEAKVKAEVQR